MPATPAPSPFTSPFTSPLHIHSQARVLRTRLSSASSGATGVGAAVLGPALGPTGGGGRPVGVGATLGAPLKEGGAGAMGVPMLGVAAGVPPGVPEMLPRVDRGREGGELFCDCGLERCCCVCWGDWEWPYSCWRCWICRAWVLVCCSSATYSGE
jgi:hypothetical protein